MTVTDLKSLDKKRYKVYLDGEFAFVLYGGELRDYSVKVGRELPENVVDTIMETVLPKRAKLRAMNLLQKKDYTKKQLEEKLSEGLYPQEIIDEAIEYVESYHYLDDERYARDYITYHMSLRSRNRILQDLSVKGIDKEITLRLMDELYDEEAEDPELSQVIKLLEKKHYDPENADLKERQKLIAFLMRKGFSGATISKAMKNYEN